MLTQENLLARLDSFPHLSFADYPTPLEFLPRLSQQESRPIYIKRDDEIGPGMGGNKTRKLEYLLADALQQKKSKVVTFGGLQSNHARLTAAAARKVGLEPHLFYFERRPPSLAGNLLLNALLDAKLHFLPIGGGTGGMTLEQTISLVHLVAWARLGPHYFIPVGGHNWLGCLGYVRAALEIDAQARQMGIGDAWLVVAAGSGGTLAGLMAGLTLAHSSLRLAGVDVAKLWKAFPASIAHLAEEICARLGSTHPFQASQVPVIEGRYVGSGYAQPTPEGMAAIRLLARAEGILLDPVYTGKTFAGLLDLVRRNELGGNAPVIFLHTGGAPALFT